MSIDGLDIVRYYAAASDYSKNFDVNFLYIITTHIST